MSKTCDIKNCFPVKQILVCNLPRCSWQQRLSRNKRGLQLTRLFRDFISGPHNWGFKEQSTSNSSCSYFVAIHSMLSRRAIYFMLYIAFNFCSSRQTIYYALYTLLVTSDFYYLLHSVLKLPVPVIFSLVCENKLNVYSFSFRPNKLVYRWS